MTLLALPWIEIALLTLALGAVAVRFFARDPAAAGRLTLACTVVALAGTLLAWAAVLNDVPATGPSLSAALLGRRLLIADSLSGPLLVLVALLHVLTVLTTAAVKLNRMSLTGHLAGEALRLATFACLEPWPLIGLLALSTVPPYLELVSRGRPTRIYLLHMLVFVALLVGGWAAVSAGAAWGSALLLAAVLVRSGTFPAHLWVSDLFQHASFGTAILYATPIAGMYAAIRLVLPVAPDWVLQSIGVASLVTAVYASGLAVVQRDARRFFAYLFLSHASLVLVGLELHTATSLTGALALWASVALSLGGLGLVLRGLVARHGPLSLDRFHGLYEQSPTLAVGFLVTGLASVGFPGTLGFVAAELLVDGAIEANIFVGLTLLTAAALNGIGVVRVYLRLFTGTTAPTTLPMETTGKERLAILILSALLLGGGLFPQPGIEDRHASALRLIAERAAPETPER